MEERKLLTGKPVSPGIAVAEVYYYEPLMLSTETGYFKAGKETEYWRAFKEALEKAKQELQELQAKVASDDEMAAGIFGAHLTILKDEDLLYEIKSAILNDRMCPELAIEACMGEMITSIGNIKDPMAEKYIADIYDVKHRLLSSYLKKVDTGLLHLSKDVIVVAKDLMPSDVATIDRSHVKGIITESEGTNTHTAVMARSYGIPMITGVAEVRKLLPNGNLIEMDGVAGTIRIEAVTE